MEFLNLVILAMAITRLSQLVTDEYGLFGIFERLRNLAGVNENKEGGRVDQDEAQSNQLSAILSCIRCASLWIAIGAVIAYYLAPDPVIWIALPFALSEAAIMIDLRT